MFNLFKWWRRFVRRADAHYLWPALYEMSGGCRKLFLIAAAKHISIDPAWKYKDEWLNTIENPEHFWLRINL